MQHKFTPTTHLKRAALTLLALVFACATPSAAFAQNLAEYAFTTGVDQNQWITLSNSATQIVASGQDDAYSSLTNIGFSFPFGDGTYTQFWANSNGIFSFNSTPTLAYAHQFDPYECSENQPKICGITRDMSTGNNGYVKYELTGTSPNRVLVCEFYLYGDAILTPASIKWQVQLHESDAKVVMVYGASSSDPSDFQIGLSQSGSDIWTVNPSTHEATHLTEGVETQYAVWPGENRYYEFAPPAPFSDNGDNTYTINSAEGWGMFCDTLTLKPSGYFTGKTVKLGANISITQSAGSDDHRFTGTFDGQEHTLNVNITDTQNQGTAPFRFISNATIRNLHVTGTVTGTAHAAGLVGKACAGTILIENCLVEANVSSTVGDTNGNKHCGGIVGHGFGNNQNPNSVSLTLRNCVYAGTITCDQNYIGGLQGWSDGNTLTLENCLFAGNYQGTATGTALFHPIALHNTGKSTNLTATNVFTAVAPTVTNTAFIAANGTKTTGRTTAPDNLGTQGATYSFMNMTVYQNGLYYNGLYYVAPTLSTDNDNAYLINNEDDWAYFCDMLYDNDTWNRFSGETVKLNADISVTRMAGSSYHDFCGTFDGQHNTLTFTSTTSGDRVAPFSFISSTMPVGSNTNSPAVIRNLNVVVDITANGQYAGGLVGEAWGEFTIEHCTVSGTITTSNQFAGGIIGRVSNTPLNITDCVSSVIINSSVNGDGTHGGIAALVASGSNITLNISGCLFDGKIVTTNGTTNCGGFVGHDSNSGGNRVTITNSIFAPKPDDNTVSTGCATFGRNVSSDLITNCYYTTALGTAQGTQAYSINKGQYVTTLENAGIFGDRYTTSGLFFYTTGFKCGDVLYAAANDVVSLTLGCTPPAGYTCTGYTATAGNLNGTTLTMPNENVTINVTLEELPEVSYIDENGTTHTTNNYTIISDNSVTRFGQYDNVERWYVVTGTVNFTSPIYFKSNSNIIIADGAALNVGTVESPVSDYNGGIFSYFDLKIYAESGSTGHVSVYSASNRRAISNEGGELVIVNCEVNASGSVGIYDTHTGINIVGCQLNLAGGNGVQSATGPVTLKNTTLTAPSLDGSVIYSPVDLTLDSCTVVAVTSATSIHAIESDGGTNGIIIKNNSNINVETTTDRNSNGIYSLMDVSIEGSMVEAKGNRGIVAGGAVTITDATVKATGGSSAIWASSSITLDGSDVTAKSTGYHAIYANNGNITIRNNGKTVAESPNDYGCYAICTYQGGNVIIESGSVEATGYRGITANGNVNISGGQVKATGLVYGIWAAGNLTLGWTNANDSIYASSYYVNGGTLAIAEGKAFIDEDGNTYESGAVNASDINGKTLYPRCVTYLDENGEQQLCTEYTLLQTGMDLSNSLPGGWYVAEGTVNFNHELSFLGDFHIILKDNAVMTIGTEQNPVNSEGIRGYGSNCSISFYAQSTGDSKGQLHINSMSYGIYNTAGAANVIINGGWVTIIGEYYGIYCYHATINGGEVTATGLVNGILGCYTVTINGGKVIGRCGNSQYSSGGINGGTSVTLGWRNPTDFIYSDKYYHPSTIAIAEGQAFIDEDGHTYSGTIAWDETTQTYPIDGKTLYPYIEGSVPYIDENGQRQLCIEYNVLNGNETTLGTASQETWYVADGTLDYSQTINLSGDVHLILKDNAVMNVGTQSTITSGIGDGSSTASISIYGQSTGNSKGQLHVNASAVGIFAKDGNLTINGGEVVVTSSGTYGLGIFANGGNITINGGQVSSAGYYGIYASNGDITISGGEVSATSTGTDIYSYGIYASNGNITINSGEVTANGPCGIFVRGGNIAINGGEVEATGSENGGEGIIVLKSGSNGGSISISNATVTASGSIGIHANSGITINSGTVTTNNCNYGIYASSCSLTINGGQVTANGSTYGIWSEGDLTLGWTNASDYIHANSYLAGGTLSIAEGKAFIDEDNAVYSGTIPRVNGAYAINGKTLHPYIQESVPYLDENGDTLQCTAYTPLTGNETTLAAGWYVADGMLNYNQTLTLSGEVHLILKDNAVMNVGTAESPISGHGINGNSHSISIYAQSMGDSKGQLHVDANACGIFAQSGNVNICGGEVETTGYSGIQANNASVNIRGGQVTANGSNYGIYASSNNLTISGGQVTADGSTYGIYGNNITLGWTNPTDYIYVNKYYAGGTLSIAEGKAFITEDGIAFESGTVNASAINGKTLYPYIQGSVPYLDENGEQQLCTEYTVLTGTETSLAAGWYVADGMLNYNQTLTLSGEVHLILKDNAVMNVGTAESPISGHGINGNSHSISIYAQSMGDSKGQLHVDANACGIFAQSGNVNICGGEVEATADYSINVICNGENGGILTISNATVTVTGETMGIYAQGITINSGTVTANGSYGLYDDGGNLNINGGQVTATGSDYGIFASNGNITISGGQVTANGSTYGIYTYGSDITLGWTNASDYIYANSYYANHGTLSIATGKTFIDEDGMEHPSGTVNASEINGKWLYPSEASIYTKTVAGYGTGNGGWVFIASPVAADIAPTAVAHLMATPATDYDLYRFNQSDAHGNEWQNWKATTTENHPDFTTLVNGQGYLYATKETKTLVFAGEFTAATEPVEVPLDYDEYAELAGWNLVGNPFATQATMTNGNGQAVSFYVINGQNVVPYEGSATTIEPCTGVMVKAEGTGESVFFTSVSPDEAPQPNNGNLQIALSQVPEPVEGPARNDNVYSGVGVSTSSTTLIDNAIISFNEGSKLSKFYFGTQNANIYIPQGQEEYAIAYSNGQGEMPLNFKAEENGTYTLTVSTTLNSKLSTLNYLHLIDNLTGADVDLLTPPAYGHPLSEGEAQSGAELGSDRPATDSRTPAGVPPLQRGQGGFNYTFTAKTTDYESRFKLVFSICEDANGDNEAFAFISNGNIIVNGEGTLQIFDVLGHQLITKQLPTLNSQLSTLNYTPGVYVLRLIDGEKVRTQKIVIE